MRKTTLAIAAVGAALPLLSAAPAQAQATRTWVSGVGNDVDPCSRTAPCKTFAGAMSKTAINGEINCLDPGGFGAVTITRSITIDCTGTMGSILASNTTGVVINIPGANVVLRNLSINGTSGCAVGGVQPCPPNLPGFNGIRFLQNGSLHVDNVIVQNFNAAGAANGNCVDFRPTGTSKLTITNSYFYNCGNAAAGAAVLVKPTGGATTALISRTIMERSFSGVTLDSTAGTVGINVTVEDSGIYGNANDGLSANSAGVGLSALVERTAVKGNGTGLHSNGNAAAVVRINNSSITANGTATSATAGGLVQSFLNNVINANGVDTAPPGVPGGLH